MKKYRIKSIAILLVAALLLPVALGVGIAEAASILSSSSSSMSAYIAFYNAHDEETSLYVQKLVEGEGAPEDDEFEFIIQLNGSVARDLMYTLYNEEGSRIYVYDGEQTTVQDPTKFEDALKTDRNGTFKLKDGQMAKFEGLSPGDTYEVVEVPFEPYQQIQPAANTPARGTLTLEGVKEVFKNLYPDVEDGKLEVRKSISFLNNYEVPETPDFLFKITIGNKPYADQEFQILPEDSDDPIGTGTTDSAGEFTLQGKTRAVFENIPVDKDYRVEELMGTEAENAGWRVIGDSVQEGGTSTNGTLLNFTNVLASFAVSKAMFGGVAVDDTFEFQVLNGDKQPFGQSLEYYLYNSAHQLADEEIHQTGTDGTFTMKAGQTAVFIGLDAGTEYGVRETNCGRYIQFLPGTGEGYGDNVVMDSVEILPFINATIPSRTLLTVHKSVVNNAPSGEKVPDLDFTFQISKLVDGEYVPVGHAAYDIVDVTGTSTYSADENGIFTLRAWETARFVELNKGDTYKVEELESELPDGFEIGGSGSREGELGDDVLAMEFENTYKGHQDPYVSIRKKTVKGNMLKDAKLVLIKKDGDEETVLHEWISQETQEEFQVKPGTYYIRELEAPTGYIVADDVEITVVKDVRLQEFEMVDHRDTDVPTGVEERHSHLVRMIAAFAIALAAAAALYIGVIRRRRQTR